MTPPSHTPQPVIDAMVTVSNHLKAQGYGSVVIGPEPGGAIFGKRSILEDKQELLGMIWRLLKERQRLVRVQTNLRNFIRRTDPFVGLSRPDWYEGELAKVLKRGKPHF